MSFFLEGRHLLYVMLASYVLGMATAFGLVLGSA